MRALLLPLAITIADVFCEVGNLDHVSDCFICNHVLTTAMMVRGSSADTFEYYLNWMCNQTKSYVQKRPTCNRMAAEFLANNCLREKYADRNFPHDTRTGTFMCEYFFPQKYCRDGKYA
ncbi:hypothetical protein Aduo_001048 [Ancylostoma duodenale]